MARLMHRWNIFPRLLSHWWKSIKGQGFKRNGIGIFFRGEKHKRKGETFSTKIGKRWSSSGHLKDTSATWDPPQVIRHSVINHRSITLLYQTPTRFLLGPSIVGYTLNHHTINWGLGPTIPTSLWATPPQYWIATLLFWGFWKNRRILIEDWPTWL